MSRAFWSLPLWLGVLVLGSSCSTSTPSGPSIDELPAMLAAQACTALEGCLDARTLHQAFGEPGCKPRLQAEIEDSDFAYVKDSIDAGRAHYDSSKVDACLDAIKILGCNFATTRIFEKPECKGILTGSVKSGGKCAVGADCQSGLFCKHNPDSCPGTCSPHLAEGDPCERDDQCKDGLACSKSSSTCAAPSQAGEACGGGVAGDCAGGLSCVGADDTKGVSGMCRHTNSILTAALGAECDLSNGVLCKEGLTCVVTSSSPTPSFACQKPAPANGACHFGVPASCDSDQYCSADITSGQISGMCTAEPKGGESCATIAGSPACAPGLLCDTTDNRCHPVNRLGQPCVSDDGCSSAHCVSGKCQRPKQCSL